MSTRDLLIEIGLEELPARFVTASMNQLADKLKNWLVEKNISFSQIKTFSTPRRLAVLISNVAEKQADVELDAKGPTKKIAIDSAGNWTKAAIGFTRGQNMTVDDIYFKEINGVEYAHIKKYIKGQETFYSLPDVQGLITSLTFPKNMRWGDEELRFARPIKWLTAIFGDQIIPFSITNVSSSNKTEGHRFLGKERVLTKADDYEAVLLAECVLADPVKRKETIVNQIKKIEKENNWIIPVDADLLEEVNNLVEYPTTLFGKFESEYLHLPEEVLVTSMKEHQRYFPVKNQAGKLLPYFITVRNGDDRFLENVTKGNEKVLRARLSDADFFYREDQKRNIDELVKKLDSIVYHEDLGSIGDKVRRIKSLAMKVSTSLPLDRSVNKLVERAAHLSKFDLVTNMVYEFPELQGFMGERYARIKGEDEAVAKAINEHYKPRHADDSVPTSQLGSIISVSDKLDTIVGCFAIGIIPTGSQDPYALRRQAAGIVQILLANEWNVSLAQLLELALNQFEEENKCKRERLQVLQDLIGFFKLRLKNEMSNRGIRYDIIDGVLGTNITSIPVLIKKANLLEMKKNDPNFKGIVESLGRVLNIAAKAEKRGAINKTLFSSKQEEALYEQYLLVEKEVEKALAQGNVADAYNELSSLKPLIDAYFDHTMIMANDLEVKQNRLSQMAQLANVIYLFADMNAIKVK